MPGLIHFPADDSICDDDELKQLTSETKKWVLAKGRRVLRWDASKKRNEALDCFVYALAALRISQDKFGLDLDELAKGQPQARAQADDEQSEIEQPEAAAEPIETPAPAPVPEPANLQPAAEPAPAGGWITTGQGAWL